MPISDKMAFGGDVDTLSLTFDKLQYIFNGYGQIRDSFVEANTLYKQEKILENEFFVKTQEGVMRFSALDFLAIKAIFEMKKAIDRGIGTNMANATAGVPPVPNMSPQTHSLSSFIVAGTIPRAENIMSRAKQKGKNCTQCRVWVKSDANFCTNCGNKI